MKLLEAIDSDGKLSALGRSVRTLALIVFMHVFLYASFSCNLKYLLNFYDALIHQMARFPLDPLYARALLASQSLHCGQEIIK